MLKLIKYNSILFLVFSISFGCKNPAVENHTTEKQINPEELKKQFIKANQQLVQKESDEMDYYSKTHQMPFVKTTSGVRHYVYEHSAKGDSIKDGSEITMGFKVFLLDGTEVYSSNQLGKKTFIVGYENIESGIHKGVQYLKRGDKALLLIPSHLAHGLLGDSKKIPPQMPIVYDIQID